MRRLSKLFLLAGCWAGLLIAFLLENATLKVAFGLPIVLIFPGLLIVHLLNIQAKPAERWALICAISLAVLIGSVMVASLTPIGITSSSILRILAAVTTLLYEADLIASRWRVVSTIDPLAGRGGDSIPNNGESPISRRTVIAWCVSGGIVVASLCGSIWLSMTSERAVSEPNFTQLSLIHQGDSKVCRIEITNLEGSEAKYQLEISLPVTGTTLETITVEAQHSYKQDIVVNHSGEVVARLYGGSGTDSGYRQVKAVIL